MASTRVSEDVKYNPPLRVVEMIKDPINVNTYYDQVTEFNKDVQQWENRFLSFKDLVHRTEATSLRMRR